MKTSKTILLSIAGVVILLSVILALSLWPHTLRDDECSPIYQRYCHTPGVEASFTKDFRINDTLTIDATLLHATDSASWERLLNDFQISTEFRKKQSPKHTIFRFSQKGQTKKTIDNNILNNDFIAFSLTEKRIIIFHITNNDQIESCILRMLNKTLKQ